MKPVRSAERGFALVMALLVVVVITLMVLGAISFTGTERMTAAAQSRDDQLSTCMQAARGAFLARVRLLEQNTERVSFTNLVMSENPADPSDRVTVSTRHYSLGTDAGLPSAEILHVERVPKHKLGASAAGGEDITNRVGLRGSGLGQIFYKVTVLCQERTGGPEREIEFIVGLGT